MYIEYVKDFFKKHNCELLSTTYVNSGEKIDYKCECGTIAKTTFDDFKYGNRCRNCWTAKRTGPNHFAWNPNREEIKLNKTLHSRATHYLKRTLILRGEDKKDKKAKLLGYTMLELKSHLLNHPNWLIVCNENWNIDHIFPIAAFARHKITDIKIINSLDNLQPLTTYDNIIKGDKYNQIEFTEWLASKGIII